MDNKDSRDHIKELEQDLYSREFKAEVSPRNPLTTDQKPPSSTWPHESVPQPKPFIPPPISRKSSLFKKILIIAALFFLFSAVTTAFVLYGGLNFISTNKVEISFEGPVSIAAGEELTFDVVIHNQNRTDLVNPTLYIDYPDGTKNPVDLSQDLLHSKETLNEIPAQTNVKHTVKAVLFGSQYADKDIKVTLEYGLKASNGVFKKDNTYIVHINSTPLTMNIDHLGETASGQEVSFTVDIMSNSRVPLTDLALRADYPRGFTFTNSDPEALDASVWKIPVLKPGEKKTIILKGKVEGEENDEKIFRFNVGIRDAVNDKAIATSFLTSSESIVVRRPAFGTVLSFDSLVNPGQTITGEVKLTNNTSDELGNVYAELLVGGNAVDFTTPRADGALYRLPSHTLFWDKTTLPGLGSLGPGQSITLPFVLNALPQSVLASVQNGQITLSFKTTATDKSSGQVISNQTTRSAKVQPSFRVIPQIVYSTGSFKNTGPVPPKAEVKTTYTVTWRATYTTNEINNIEVHGSLPSYVKWLNVISPSNAAIQWFPDRNEIIWQAGTIPPGTVGLTAKEVSFQVEVYPSYSQIDTTPIVVDNVWFKARDGFTGVSISSKGTALTTYLGADPQYSNQSGKVVE